MRFRDPYAATICAALLATVNAAPAVKNVRADTTCGVTTVYVTIRPDLQSFDHTKTSDIVPSGYNTLVSTPGGSASSIADGISGEPINSIGTALTTLRSVAISSFDATAVSPSNHPGGGNPLSSTASVFPMPSSDHYTSTKSAGGANTSADYNVGGKASNTGIVVVDETLTVIPLSTIPAPATSTDQVITPAITTTLVSVKPTDHPASVTPAAPNISTGISEANGLANTQSSGSSVIRGWNTTSSSGSNLVTGDSSLSSSTLSTSLSSSIICSRCLELPTNIVTGAAHSGFVSFPTSSPGSLVVESSSLSLNSSTGSQSSLISSVSAVIALATAVNVSSSGTVTEGGFTVAASSTMASVVVVANSTLPVARPRSDTIIQSSTDSSTLLPLSTSSPTSGYQPELNNSGLNLTASAAPTPFNSEADGIASSLMTTSDVTLTQFVTSVIATTTETFTTSMTTSRGPAVSSGAEGLDSSISSSLGSAENAGPTSASSSLDMATTTMSSMNSSQAQPTICTEPEFIELDFDDLPPQAAFDNATAQPMPLFSPYRKFYFSGGWTIVPPPTDPYLPSSGRLLVEFLATPLSDLGTSGAIGNGRNELSGCFNFNAISLKVGCDSKGPDCDWYFSGYQYNLASSTFDQITSQNISTPACPELNNCSLIPITLDYSFRNMTEIRIHLTVAGEDKIWWMDDLCLEWFEKGCDAQLCRSHVR